MNKCNICGKVSMIDGDMQGHDSSRCISGLRVVDGKISLPRSAEVSTFARIEVPLGSVFDDGKWKMKSCFIFVPSGTQPNNSVTDYYSNIGSIFNAIPLLFN